MLYTKICGRTRIARNTHQVLPIIVVDRYLDYFTTIMEDRLWQVLAKPVFRWKNKFGLSTD